MCVLYGIYTHNKHMIYVNVHKHAYVLLYFMYYKYFIHLYIFIYLYTYIYTHIKHGGEKMLGMRFLSVTRRSTQQSRHSSENSRAAEANFF